MEPSLGGNLRLSSTTTHPLAKLNIVQVIKRCSGKRLSHIERRYELVIEIVEG